MLIDKTTAGAHDRSSTVMQPAGLLVADAYMRTINVSSAARPENLEETDAILWILASSTLPAGGVVS